MLVYQPLSAAAIKVHGAPHMPVSVRIYILLFYLITKIMCLTCRAFSKNTDELDI